jgi:hypothetical protein
VSVLSFHMGSPPKPIRQCGEVPIIQVKYNADRTVERRDEVKEWHEGFSKAD